MEIPFGKVSYGKEEEEAVLKVMRSGWLAAGKETEAFEKEFSNYITPGEYDKDGNKYIKDPYYCIFTNSGTSALKMAYKLVKEKGIYGVIYPRNTFCATYSAAREMELKAIPRGVRIPGTYVNVNVHYGGVLDKGDCVIEDSAHRIEPNDPLVGKIRCYSFYATKNMTTGSGGMLVTNDKEIYERCRLYWRDGLTSSTKERQTGKSFDYKVETMAGGYDGNDIAAALGRVQLRRLPDFNKRRNEIRDRYNDSFGGDWQGNHLYPYFVDREQDVGSLIERLKRAGIGCGYHYPGTGWLGVSLPIYPDLTYQEQDYIIKTVKQWQNKSKSMSG